MPAPAYDPGALSEGGFVETTHIFANGLAGTLTRPREVVTSRPAVILLNAGLVQRCGPFRIYAQLARALASCGFVVLRFDQSGLGDSLPSPAVEANRKCSEATAAMALVTSLTGCQRFVLAGICSGADDAFRLSADEPRVAGMILLDGLAYRTFGYLLHHYLPRLLRPATILRRLGRVLSPSQRERALDEGDFRDFPDRQDAITQLRVLTDRNARLLFLYTGGASRYLNHIGQARRCFGPVMDSDQVTLEYWPECDHTFYLRRDRIRLHTLVTSWMRTEFLAGT